MKFAPNEGARPAQFVDDEASDNEYANVDDVDDDAFQDEPAHQEMTSKLENEIFF